MWQSCGNRVAIARQSCGTRVVLGCRHLMAWVELEGGVIFQKKHEKSKSTQTFGFLTVHVSISFPYQPMQGGLVVSKSVFPRSLGQPPGRGKFWPNDVLSFLRSWFGSTPIRGFLDLRYQGCAISRMKQKKSNPNMYVDLHSMLAGLHQATRFV